MTEGRGQMAEDRGQMAEFGSGKSECGMRNSEVGMIEHGAEGIAHSVQLENSEKSDALPYALCFRQYATCSVTRNTKCIKRNLYYYGTQ
jgi:hypothetical protein